MYLPKQVFNVDKTRLYWKKMPDQSYTSMEEKVNASLESSKGYADSVV